MIEWKNWILFFQGLEAKTLSFPVPNAGFVEKKKTPQKNPTQNQKIPSVLFLLWWSSQHTAEVWFPDTVFEICGELRRSKAKPVEAASFLVGALALVYETLHIIPSCVIFSSWNSEKVLQG